jgi:hypothetical protein
MLIARGLAVSVVLVACSKSAPPIAAKDGADGLRELFTHAQAACSAKDFAKGAKIVASIIPAKDHLHKALKDDAPADLVDRVVEQSKELPADEEKTACLLSPPGRTQINVHRATTEELAAHVEGTTATVEFPAGAQMLSAFLRPQTVFYEVETVEPGKDRGTKFHMFYWDGSQWRMLGPAWRYLPGAESDRHPMQ